MGEKMSKTHHHVVRKHPNIDQKSKAQKNKKEKQTTHQRD